jgi:hypothetical protein
MSAMGEERNILRPFLLGRLSGLIDCKEAFKVVK